MHGVRRAGGLLLRAACVRLNTTSSARAAATLDKRAVDMAASVVTKQQPVQEQVQTSARVAGEYLEVTLGHDVIERFPTAWLRDNCQCAACFSPHLNSRTVDWETFDPNIKPTSVQVAGDHVEVTWADDHVSRFHVRWLQNRSFSAHARQAWLDAVYRPPKRAWSAAEFPRVLRRFNFQRVIDSDGELQAWLEQMALHGVAIIEDTPLQFDQVRRLADRVAFIKKTHYGEEFEVIAKSDTSNLAYTPVKLQFHTDLPYYEYKPGLNLLHCMVQAQGSGGENQLTDCLNISNILREHHPEDFRVLTQTLVEWNDIGADLEGSFYSIFRAPAICLDRSGKFDRVNYSQQQRDSHFKVPLEDAVAWYRAHKTLTTLMHHADNTVFFKTRPGEILTFDNIRMVHGRNGYDDSEDNRRHLVGCYLDWDVCYSKLRLLKRRQNPDQYQ